MTQVLSHARKCHVCGIADCAQVWCCVYIFHLATVKTKMSSSFASYWPQHVRCYSTHCTSDPLPHITPNHKATHTRATRHPQVNAGVWSSVMINSRAEQSTDKCIMHRRQGTMMELIGHSHICPPIFSNFRSALNSEQSEHQESSCQALADIFCKFWPIPEFV